MSQLHPASAAVCIATACLLTGLSFSAEPRPVDVATIQESKTVAKPQTPIGATAVNTQPAEPVKPAAECQDYADAIAESYAHRTLVVVTYTGCPPCAALEAALTRDGVHFAEVNREKHPGTFYSFRASRFPTWSVLRNGSVVASGTGSMPAAFFKQILAEETQ